MPEGIIRDPKQNQHHEESYGIVYCPDEENPGHPNGKYFRYSKTAGHESRTSLAGEDVFVNIISNHNDPIEWIDHIPIHGEAEFEYKLDPQKGPVYKRHFTNLPHTAREANIRNAIKQGEITSDLETMEDLENSSV